MRDFYRWEMRDGGHSEASLEPVRALLSRKLHSALVAVSRQESACARAAPPDMKPYIIDGDPWYYYAQDGAKELVSTSANVSTQAASVDARLRYDDLAWTDTVILAKESGRWVIADIRFEQGGSLTASLLQYAQAAATECRPPA